MVNLLVYLSAIVLTSFIVFVMSVYYFYKKRFSYWEDKHVPFTKPAFPLGTKADFTKSPGEMIQDLYMKTKHEKVFGTWSFFKPIMLVNDLELIKNIFVRDFIHFHDRGFHVNEEDDPLSAHLFSLNGSPWRNLRVKLTPTFTSGKMKMMFPMIVECGNQLVNYLKESAQIGDSVEFKELVARFGTDVISSCAFGIETNSINNPECEFRKIGKRMVQPTVVEEIKNILTFLAPDLAKRLKIKLVSSDIEDFFVAAVKDTIDYRIKNDVKRNDFLQLLMELVNKGHIDEVDQNNDHTDKQPFTVTEATAQAFVFFLGGFETSTTTLQFALYEIAKDEDVQSKVQREVDEILEQYGQLSYDAMNDMVYLDKVISETLRKYPPIPLLMRECTKDYKIPDTDIVIPKDTAVHVAILGIHRDPQIFSEPDKFDPERFTEEAKSKRHRFSFLPFGEGPRVCIGNRFALMQIKVGLSMLLSKYQFSFSDKTPNPVVFDRSSFVLTSFKGMHLKITNRAG